ncbi:MAG: M4 family metallopeptidase [Bacteroidia bacterium]|nr:M4 family metallopeptidase [Bacteroidia bacterium]
MSAVLRTGFLIGLLALAPMLPAQHLRTTPRLAEIGYELESPGWVQLLPGTQIRPEALFADYGAAFGLRPGETMTLLRTEYDELGMGHHRYQLAVGGIPVEGARVVVHSQYGKVRSLNGWLPVVTPSQALVTREDARAAALQAVGGLTWMWENPGAEAALRHAQGDPAATFFPAGELVYADSDYDPVNGSALRLVWKFDVYAETPHTRQWVYVDAQTGAVIKSLETLHTTNTPGTALTRYAGERTITTDATGTNFRLRETNRGLGVDIETYDMNQTTDFALAVDFTDDDNYWNNVNAEFDEAATDAHFGTEMAYDYYLTKHNRHSYNNSGSPLVSYVHFDVAYFNAFWNGVWMTYGDGNGAPLTTLDVVAHELTHGVTQFSAELVYAYESGALNESFSDIFGNLVEYEADSILADWRIGEGFGAFRSMQNPNAFGNPDTYKGQSWSVGSFDNGGVHINSGVQNFWFYLLSVGGSGTNDKNRAYSVTGIGRDKAAQIAYRVLTVYLTPFSQYEDARIASLQAAADLYGTCGEEYKAVAAAWYAVGLGFPIQENDFGVVGIYPIEPCGPEEELVKIRVQYLGCDSFPGGPLQLAYFAQPFQVAVENVNLPAIPGGFAFDYTFNQPLNLTDPGGYQLISRTLSLSDPNFLNDSSEFLFTYNTVPLTNQHISFESYATGQAVFDTLYVRRGAQTRAVVEPGLGKDGSFSLLFEGGKRDNFSFFNASFDDFAFNQDYQSSACMCMDATRLDSLGLSFDLRQTYSKFREINLGIDSLEAAAKVNILRLTVDGVEISRYSPVTHTQDTFRTHRILLNDKLGGVFNLCFEGLTNQSKEIDGFDIGDRILLDNIRFTSVRNTTGVSPVLAGTLQLYPNPTEGIVTLSYQGAETGPLALEVWDMAGRRISQRQLLPVAGAAQTVIDLRGQAAGLYLVRLSGDTGSLTSKVLVKP